MNSISKPRSVLSLAQLGDAVNSAEPADAAVREKSLPQRWRLTALASAYLDGIRGLAALAVMLGHCRAFFFVDYGNINVEMATPLVRALYMVTGFGHQAVMVFFVLSGFLISSSIFRSYERRSWSWRTYAIDRGVRLYVVLLPGLLLGLLWDFSGIHFFNSTGIYSNPLVPFGDGIPIQSLTLVAFVGNILFVQTRFTPVFGSNGPLWSLFNEFWYYLLFPLLVAGFSSLRRRALFTSIGFLALATLVVWIIRAQVVGFVVWLAGAAVAISTADLKFARSRKWLLATYLACTCAMTLACLLAARARNNPFGSDLAVGVSFALLMHAIIQLDVPIGSLGMMLAKTFSGFSYSLYVLHFPLLFIIRAAWLPKLRWQPDLAHLLCSALIGGIAIMYAYLVAKLTEAKTSSAKAFIQRKLSSASPNHSNSCS